MIFRNKTHENNYIEVLSRMKSKDCYHQAVAYLVSLDVVCCNHIDDIFDFTDDVINPDCFGNGWQTSTSRKTIRLAFNLWNGYCCDGETYVTRSGYVEDLPSSSYTPDSIFCCGYAPYYWEAVKLRFPEYC